MDPDGEWPFRSFLARYVDASGLKPGQIAERCVSEVGQQITGRRISQMLSGDARSTKWQVVEALSLVLGFDFDEGMRAAGLSMPTDRHRKTDPIVTWTLDEMLDAIRGRYAELERAITDGPLPALSRAQRRARGRTVTELASLAEQLRGDDPAGAELIQTLADRLLAQIESHAVGATISADGAVRPRRS